MPAKKLAHAFKFTRQPVHSEPYFEKGDYLMEIKQVKLNVRDEPFIQFQVTRSHHGRRVNQYYSINFYLNGEKPAGRELWHRKFNELLEAVQLDEIESLSVLVGKTVCMNISKTGFSPLPNFRHPNTFKNIQPATSVSPDEDYSMEDDIPF